MEMTSPEPCPEHPPSNPQTVEVRPGLRSSVLVVFGTLLQCSLFPRQYRPLPHQHPCSGPGLALDSTLYVLVAFSSRLKDWKDGRRRAQVTPDRLLTLQGRGVGGSRDFSGRHGCLHAASVMGRIRLLAAFGAAAVVGTVRPNLCASYLSPGYLSDAK
jgi:hypothetical protein